jgi:protein-disulfide isomerase
VISIKKSYLLVAVLGVAAVIVGYLLLSGPGAEGYIRSYSPVLGSGTINVVEFSDYECPYCQAAEGNNQAVIDELRSRNPAWEPAVPNIISEYVEAGKVNLIFRHFPAHGNINAAMASYCAQDQGMFWEYHNLLFENYENLTLSDLMNTHPTLE